MKGRGVLVIACCLALFGADTYVSILNIANDVPYELVKPLEVGDFLCAWSVYNSSVDGESFRVRIVGANDELILLQADFHPSNGAVEMNSYLPLNDGWQTELSLEFDPIQFVDGTSIKVCVEVNTDEYRIFLNDEELSPGFPQTVPYSDGSAVKLYGGGFVWFALRIPNYPEVEDESTACEPSYSASSNATQTISSLNYPDNYPNSESCISVITSVYNSRHVVRLEFSAFDLENHASCSYDSLEIRDGDSASSTLIGKYCGSTSPGTIVSSGNALYLHFSTDSSVVNTGYKASFTAFLDLSLYLGLDPDQPEVDHSLDGPVDLGLDPDQPEVDHSPWTTGPWSRP